MTSGVTILISLLRRGVFALLLAAFLVPMPRPTHAEEVRALYAAQGLLCAVNEEGQPHREAHCVLCVLPDSSAAPECKLADRELEFKAISYAAERLILGKTDAITRHARAPPIRFA